MVEPAVGISVVVGHAVPDSREMVQLGEVAGKRCLSEVRRFTCLTNAFRKSRWHHAAMLALFFARFNFCRKHSAVKATPAVAAGIASEAWSIERLLAKAAKVAA